MTVVATITPISPVDRLGEIKAQIAELKAVEAFLIDEIKAMGAGAHEGAAYRASVSEVAARSAPDPKAMEEKLVELGVENPDSYQIENWGSMAAGSAATRRPRRPT